MLFPQNGNRAGLYLRLSRDDDTKKESYSITNQRKILSSYAEEHGFKVIDEYIGDGISGTSFQRPGFDRMPAEQKKKADETEQFLWPNAEYKDIRELTAPMLNELIDRIKVGAKQEYIIVLLVKISSIGRTTQYNSDFCAFLVRETHYKSEHSYIFGEIWEKFVPLLEKMDSLTYNNYMKKYLSHFSAAKMWDIPYVEAVLGSRTEETDLIDVTVTECNARFRKNGKKVHSCELDLPTGAVISRNGTMVASPELLFLELACKLSIHQLILLGLQLCSHPPGTPSDAITTKQKLNTFLAKAPGYRGYRKAMRAAKYIENGSASIMESIAYMILTLPHSLGGYGLDGAVFNYEINLKLEARIRLGQNRCFTDMYYKQAKLAVEYESFAYHNSPSEQGKDVMRSAMLERQGIDIMRLSTIQIYNRDACKDFAYNLATRLGKRIRIRTKKFDEMHAILRELLPDGKPVSKPDDRR